MLLILLMVFSEQSFAQRTCVTHWSVSVTDSSNEIYITYCGSSVLAHHAVNIIPGHGDHVMDSTVVTSHRLNWRERVTLNLDSRILPISFMSVFIREILLLEDAFRHFAFFGLVPNISDISM